MPYPVNIHYETNVSRGKVDKYVRLQTHTKPTFLIRNSPLKSANKQQTTNFSFFHIALIATILLFLLTTGSSSFAADDDYLRSLEAESTDQSSTTSTSKPGNKSGNNYLDSLSAEAESSANVSTNAQHGDDFNKQLKKMEQFLKHSKPSTYKFYKKLSKKKQERIFEKYAADKSDPDSQLSHLKKQVMDAYFKK